MKRLRMLLLVLFALLFAGVAHAADITLAWDANTESNLAGYKMYYSTTRAGGPYDGTEIPGMPSPIDIPLTALSDPANPQVSATGLPEGTYYFVVTAYDTVGNESGYSNEVGAQIDWTAPVPPGALRVVTIIQIQSP